MKVILAILVLSVANVCGDLYMQHLRGSNDRLNEANTNRNNGDRLFDSQNNAKGGYCYGPAMSFYEGSQLTVEWTVQHGCGNPKLDCNLVIQYMCGKTDETDGTIAVRDGTTTNTVDTTVASATSISTTGNDRYYQTNVDAPGQKTGTTWTFGVNEALWHYTNCSTRMRNMGLYIADRATQGLTGTTAIFTRQNNNGERSGLECSEERDYYPYWHPSPWKDIAILTDQTSRCGMYQSQSQNVQSKGYCKSATAPAPNQPGSCSAGGFTWVTVPSWGIPAPDCLSTPWNRDNHLGNGVSGFTSSYNWTLPYASTESCISDMNCNCVLRIRYNISTLDINGFGFTDYTSNGNNAPLKNDPTINLGFTIENESGLPVNGSVTLAIDTTQFARTFQDRSYIFHMIPRPSGVSATARIWNLNVRGKRGNIVQAYPATEYDFTPEQLEIKKNDYIHFQWTGCDNNPAGNAGEGTSGTDRSNMVQITGLGDTLPASASWLASNPNLFESASLKQRMAFLGQTNCLSYAALQTKDANNANTIEEDVQNCFKLNAASRYFNGGLISMNTTSTFYYMSSRNNNFSNRGQKGSIVVANLLPNWAIALTVVGGFTFLASGGVGGMMMYAKSHPHSSIGNAMSKI